MWTNWDALAGAVVDNMGTVTAVTGVKDGVTCVDTVHINHLSHLLIDKTTRGLACG